MAEYPHPGQPTQYPKTFTPYVPPPKQFQPYVPQHLSANTPSQSKFAEMKIEDSKIKTYAYNPVSTPGATGMGPGFLSPKAETQVPKSSAYFKDGKHQMKGSMILGESDPYNKYPKFEPGQGYATTDTLQNPKKMPRLSELSDMNPTMKQSSIQFGSEGYKVPSFLNKQKRPAYLSSQQRPESSCEANISKDSTGDESLNSSYGNQKKIKQASSFKNIEIKEQMTEFGKNSMKKKGRNLSIQDFSMVKQLGSGKYGKVYLAQEKQTGFICALKVLEKALIKQQQITEQLIRELKIQSFLNHTNLIKMYGFFDDNANIYLIMECATGGQLFKQIKKHQSMAESKVASIMRQVCNAVNELHSNRIIHRDIKPENIVIHDNVIKLCDFGWSVYCDSNLRTTFCGTPLYVGPEILKGKEYDEKIDIWSLGVMMYEMMVGENPFKITREEELIKIVKDDIVIPNYVEISEEGRSFLFACLQKNPDDRLSIRELLNHEFFRKYPEKSDKKLGM